VARHQPESQPGISRNDGLPSPEYAGVGREVAGSTPVAADSNEATADLFLSKNDEIPLLMAFVGSLTWIRK
jgi:hypothetical protein